MALSDTCIQLTLTSDKVNGNDRNFPERGGDLYTTTWMVLDLLPEGKGDWYASNDYI